MPSTRSSAATKCISEVPGLAKQTSTPPLTSVRTRLSAPFIVFRSRWRRFLKLGADQPLFQRSVKGRRRMAGIAVSVPHVGFLATVEREINRSRGRGLRNRAFYGLSRDHIDVSRITMTRVFALLVAAAAALAIPSGAP